MANTEHVFHDKVFSISTTPAAESMSNRTSRRIHITVDDITEIPAELFAVKVSQSKKPEKAGKTVFKYLSYRTKGTDEPRQDFAPNGVTPATPVEEIKQMFVNFLQTQGLQLEFSVSVNMPGNFGDITTSEGRVLIFDNTEFAAAEGYPGYYIKQGTRADITLRLAQGKYGQYYQVRLTTTASPDEIFVRGGRAKVWGQDDAEPSFTEPVVPQAPIAPEAPTTGNIWG